MYVLTAALNLEHTSTIETINEQDLTRRTAKNIMTWKNTNYWSTLEPSWIWAANMYQQVIWKEHTRNTHTQKTKKRTRQRHTNKTTIPSLTKLNNAPRREGVGVRRRLAKYD
jgi:hypothetical protein